ncbi:MAG: FliM/FliN family flagellar motor switch protein [Myxococcota bacterium]
MSEAAGEEALLSREELDALLAEMPAVLADETGGASKEPSSVVAAEAELQDANEGFAYAHGLKLSNRHQRVLAFSLIGQRAIQVDEMAELMLPTDLLVTFTMQPSGQAGYLLLSRPFFFQMMSMSFGSGPTIKPTRPPTREYSQIERRFYEGTAREIMKEFERQWQNIAPIEVEWQGLAGRSVVSEAKPSPAILATFEVKGFGEACRVRVAIPSAAFPAQVDESERAAAELKATSQVSVLEVPLQLRAQVGTAQLSLAEVGALVPGQLIPLDAPSDGSLVVKMGGQGKFVGVAGTRGAKRAVQLTARMQGAE